jgi:hypothetical protein
MGINLTIKIRITSPNLLRMQITLRFTINRKVKTTKLESLHVVLVDDDVVSSASSILGQEPIIVATKIIRVKFHHD